MSRLNVHALNMPAYICHRRFSLQPCLQSVPVRYLQAAFAHHCGAEAIDWGKIRALKTVEVLVSGFSRRKL